MGGPIRRRVQVTGGSTFIVSLPKEWARSVGLKQGSEVLIEVLPDYTLRVSPPYAEGRQRARVREVEVDAGSLGAVAMEILSAYLAGYDTIRVRYGGADHDAVRRAVDVARSKAIGLEVLEERAGELTLYSVVDTSSLAMREALDKMANCTRLMLEDVEAGMARCDEEVLRSVVERDDVVDKLFLLIVRQLNQLLLGELSPSELGLVALPEALHVMISVRSVERIADHAVLISENLLKAPREAMITDQVVNLFAKTKEVYVNAVRGFRSLNRRYASRVLALVEELRGLEEDVSQGIASLVGVPEAYLILDSIGRIKAYSLDIVESTINMITIREMVGARSAPQG